MHDVFEEHLDEADFLWEQWFGKLAALKPEENYRLGAESYIEIPDESQDFHVPQGVMDNLLPYETLPKW
ncbi:hypothetical protein ACN469_36485 [Corallococcus terminator]